MLARGVVTEVETGGGCDEGIFDEPAGEGLGVVGDRADVGVNVEGAAGLGGDAEAEIPQGWEEGVAALLERCPTLLQDRQGGGRERGQCRVLGHGGGGDEEVLGEALDLLGPAFWRNQPAQAPARHAEVLGKAIHHERVVELAEGGCCGVAVGQTLIDFIHDQ